MCTISVRILQKKDNKTVNIFNYYNTLTEWALDLFEVVPAVGALNMPLGCDGFTTGR